MEVYHGISETFWSRKFWLPNNVTWDDIIKKREDGVFLALPRDLWASIPMAVLLFVIRLLWERYIATPVGKSFNISDAAPRKAAKNDVLEAAYKKHGKRPSPDTLVGLGKQIDWPTRNVERWWRRRKTQSKPSEMQRFRETSWRFVFYLFIFYFGLYIMWDKPYLWDTKHCWYGYPYQEVSTELYWYYMIELGFYFSLVLSLFMDTKRKDFLEMVIHHVVTISLMLFSWSDNMVRIGSLILLIHDAVDYWMEGAKLAKYCKYNKLCDVLFVIFAVVWFITRIVIYPIRILRCTFNEGHHIVGFVPMYFLFNSLLLIIQALDILWFSIIVRMAYLYIIVGQIDKDGRSDTECSDTGDDEGADKKENEPDSNDNMKHKEGKPLMNDDQIQNGIQTRQRTK